MENKINLAPNDPIKIKTGPEEKDPKNGGKSATDLKALLDKPSLNEVRSPFSDTKKDGSVASGKPVGLDSGSQASPTTVSPRGGKSTAVIAIILTALASALIGGIIIYLWKTSQVDSAKKEVDILESQISNMQSQIGALEQDLEKEKVDNALTTEISAEGKAQTAVSLPKCNLVGKSIALKTTEKYSMFGDDVFDTVVCGFLQPKKDIIFEQEQNIAYFKVLEFADEKFKASVHQGVAEGNTVNQATVEDTYLNLGCLNENKIVSEPRGTDNPDAYIDPQTEQALLASSEAQPVAIILSFGLHEGSGCNCCNLAHKIRLIQ
ncbi:MAG: hypothetical protein FJZ04_00130 [Candidatus Moranbacteria bacterium]|nr:hypothetical protein [Candidatus Moranbacteria bacterium]